MRNSDFRICERSCKNTYIPVMIGLFTPPDNASFQKYYMKEGMNTHYKKQAMLGQ